MHFPENTPAHNTLSRQVWSPRGPKKGGQSRVRNIRPCPKKWSGRKLLWNRIPRTEKGYSEHGLKVCAKNFDAIRSDTALLSSPQRGRGVDCKHPRPRVPSAANTYYYSVLLAWFCSALGGMRRRTGKSPLDAGGLSSLSLG